MKFRNKSIHHQLSEKHHQGGRTVYVQRVRARGDKQRELEIAIGRCLRSVAIGASSESVLIHIEIVA